MPAIECTQIFNRLPLFKVFPLLRISELENNIAQYKGVSTIDLLITNHRVPLNDKDEPYISAKVRDSLYQFTRLPFRVTKGVACFHREIKKYVDKNNVKRILTYLDDITTCGKNKEEHDANQKRFIDATKLKNISSMKTRVYSQSGTFQSSNM